MSAKMKIKPEVNIALTKKQIAELEPLYQKAKYEAEVGRAGMIIGQCTTMGNFVAAFFDEKAALKIMKITGATDQGIRV